MPNNLCIACCWMDMESQKRWDKALDLVEANQIAEPNEDYMPQFNSRYAYCTHERNRLQPTEDAVAGTYMNVRKINDPPWKTCNEVRRFYPECPEWKERKPDAD